MLDLILLVLTAPVLVGCGLRLLGVERGRPVVGVVALTPYAIPAGAVPALVALVGQRWAVGVVALAPTLVLIAAVAPRARRRRYLPDGAPLRVLSANLQVGAADPQTVVGLVRQHRVDVLCLQELTADAVQALKRAGLIGELPYVVLDASDRRRGTGVASRHPIRDTPELAPSTTGVVVRTPGGPQVEVIAVHPMWPMSPAGPRPWRAAIAQLPPAAASGPIRVLAGDFNATLDHAALRRLLATGYRDAGAATGAGLRPTWPGLVRRPWPPVTIDHVLVDRRGQVRSYDVLDLPGSDHRAVLAELALPR